MTEEETKEPSVESPAGESIREMVESGNLPEDFPVEVSIKPNVDPREAVRIRKAFAEFLKSHELTLDFSVPSDSANDLALFVELKATVVSVNEDSGIARVRVEVA